MGLLAPRSQPTNGEASSARPSTSSRSLLVALCVTLLFIFGATTMVVGIIWVRTGKDVAFGGALIGSGIILNFVWCAWLISRKRDSEKRPSTFSTISASSTIKHMSSGTIQPSVNPLSPSLFLRSSTSDTSASEVSYAVVDQGGEFVRGRCSVVIPFEEIVEVVRKDEPQCIIKWRGLEGYIAATSLRFLPEEVHVADDIESNSTSNAATIPQNPMSLTGAISDLRPDSPLTLPPRKADE
eukprot:Sspe_Gene.113673::Locus_98381_Transcript_1_1_Confidence_1.000_Length_875::g.113673::m.113673